MCPRSKLDALDLPLSLTTRVAYRRAAPPSFRVAGRSVVHATRLARFKALKAAVPGIFRTAHLGTCSWNVPNGPDLPFRAAQAALRHFATCRPIPLGVSTLAGWLALAHLSMRLLGLFHVLLGLVHAASSASEA